MAWQLLLVRRSPYSSRSRTDSLRRATSPHPLLDAYRPSHANDKSTPTQFDSPSVEESSRSTVPSGTRSRSTYRGRTLGSDCGSARRRRRYVREGGDWEQGADEACRAWSGSCMFGRFGIRRVGTCRGSTISSRRSSRSSSLPTSVRSPFLPRDLSDSFSQPPTQKSTTFRLSLLRFSKPSKRIPSGAYRSCSMGSRTTTSLLNRGSSDKSPG